MKARLGLVAIALVAAQPQTASAQSRCLATDKDEGVVSVDIHLMKNWQPGSRLVGADEATSVDCSVVSGRGSVLYPSKSSSFMGVGEKTLKDTFLHIAAPDLTPSSGATYDEKQIRKYSCEASKKMCRCSLNPLTFLGCQSQRGTLWITTLRRGNRASSLGGGSG